MPGSCQHGCNHTVHEKSSKAPAYILTHLFFFFGIFLFLTRKSCFGQKSGDSTICLPEQFGSSLSAGGSISSAVSHLNTDTQAMSSVCHTHALGVVFDTLYDTMPPMEHTIHTCGGAEHHRAAQPVGTRLSVPTWKEVGVPTPPRRAHGGPSAAWPAPLCLPLAWKRRPRALGMVKRLSQAAQQFQFAF